MKEIGGYQDFERYHLPMLHGDGIKLNCGRNCLAYLIEAKKIESIWLPYYICDSVINLCKKYELTIHFFHTGYDFKPISIEAKNTDYVYLINYYGQLSADDIRDYQKQYPNLIIDNAQAYFDEPIDNVDTIYTCRKFFGVADGAILYTDNPLNRELQYDESYERMTFLMGRFERNASEFYHLMVENNKRFANEPIKKMSRLTENLLHGIDYIKVNEIRKNNYGYLKKQLKGVNKLTVPEVEGPFAYPLLIENAQEIRRSLIQKRIYVPMLWPNVLDQADDTTTDYELTNSILPIPCDQRYNAEDMQAIAALIFQLGA